MKTTRTKRTYKTKGYKQIQIYISTIHAMKHSKTLLEFYYCSTDIPLCVLVCVCVCV